MVNVGVKLMLALAMVLITVSLGSKWALAEMNHVAGGNGGWDSSSDVASWSAGRVFRVGDKIWFSYSAAQESIAELESREEYDNCNLSNPIRMYTDGLDAIPLEREGIHYFASSKPENCQNGLKLHVEVMPGQSPEITRVTASHGSASASAAGPTTPSGTAHFGASFVLVSVGLGLLYVGL